MHMQRLTKNCDRISTSKNVVHVHITTGLCIYVYTMLDYICFKECWGNKEII